MFAVKLFNRQIFFGNSRVDLITDLCFILMFNRILLDQSTIMLELASSPETLGSNTLGELKLAKSK